MLLLPENIDITRYNFCHKRLPETLEGKRIVHLSDLHSRVFEGDRLYESVAKLRPDAVFMTGDMFHDEPSSIFGILPLMRRLPLLCPTFYICGNHEKELPERVLDSILSQLREYGVNVLENSRTEFCGADIVGFVPDDEYITHFPHRIKPMLPQYVSSCIGKRSERFTILLAHDPSRFMAYCRWGADMVFSGHVHGGAVRLPVVGGLFTPSWTFFPKYQSGIYVSGRTAMVVSRGLGRERISNPPEIILLCLHRKKSVSAD